MDPALEYYFCALSPTLYTELAPIKAPILTHSGYCFLFSKLFLSFQMQLILPIDFIKQYVWLVDGYQAN